MERKLISFFSIRNMSGVFFVTTVEDGSRANKYANNPTNNPTRQQCVLILVILNTEAEYLLPASQFVIV